MLIKKERKDAQLILEVTGRLDTTTAPQLEKVIKEELTGITDLQMDFANLEYISSAGIRVLLAAFKIVKNNKGTMVISHVGTEVLSVLKMTGLSDKIELN